MKLVKSEKSGEDKEGRVKTSKLASPGLKAQEAGLKRIEEDKKVKEVLEVCNQQIKDLRYLGRDLTPD